MYRRPSCLIAAISVLSLPLVSSPASGQTEWTNETEARGHGPRERLKPVPPRVGEPVSGKSLGVRRLRPRRYLSAPPQGALSGKVVYLSPGHGYVYSNSTWGTQRPNLFNVVEDMSNADGVAQFLVPYLLAAGAQVVPVREIDPNPNMVILDDSDGQGRPAAGRYVESGDTSVFAAGSEPGWGQVTFPIAGDENPFASGATRVMTTAASETARATYALNVPASGFYYVYVSYAMGPTRASDAEVLVRHPGGETTFLVDQRRHGGTWVLLGRFYFETGLDESKGALVFTNRSQEAGKTVSADAVRIGGGMGVFDRGGGVSTQLRADECSRYYAQLAGAPNTVYNPSTKDDRTDDISTRSRFADWVHAPGEQAIYLSHHSNAYNTEARGSESYIYGENAPNGQYLPDPRIVALGSVDLANAVHGEMINDLRAEVDPSWNDRKVKSAYFGELNPSNQDEMASVLIEVAFHDQADDAALLKDARFRQVVGRALYKGIAKYFAGVDGAQPRLLPEPPQAVVARNVGAGKVSVSWQPPAFGGILGDPATSYRLYRSKGGYAFDGGTDAGAKTSVELSGLTPGEVVYLRVTAVNEGGESLPSPTLAVGVSGGAAAPVVVVAGFERLDPALNVPVPYPNLDVVDRLLLDQMNQQSYLVQHGRALSSSGVPFDACTRDAVDGAAVELGGYKMVIWQAGRGATPERGLTAASRGALASAAQAGAAVVISGSTVAGTLASGTPEDRDFLANVLGASFVSGTAHQPGVTPAATGALAGVQAFTIAGNGGIGPDPYDPGPPEVLGLAGGTATASYSGGETAAVQLKQGERCAVLFGFPLEAVTPPTHQAGLLAGVIELCGIEASTTPPPDGGVGGDGGGGGGGGGDDGCSCAVPAAPGPLGLALALTLLVAGLRRRR